MDMKKHLPHVDLEKLGKILEIKEAYQRAQIVAQIEYLGVSTVSGGALRKGLALKEKCLNSLRIKTLTVLLYRLACLCQSTFSGSGGK